MYRKKGTNESERWRDEDGINKKNTDTYTTINIFKY